MHNRSYIHMKQWKYRHFSSISALLFVHPPKLMTNWLFVDITSTQLPLQLSSPPSKLMYDLQFVDIAFAQFPPPPTIPPSTQTYVFNSPSLGPPFFIFFFLWTLLFLFYKVAKVIFVPWLLATSVIWSFISNVMPVCMASYMTAGYEYANHAFKVNVRFLS